VSSGSENYGAILALEELQFILSFIGQQNGWPKLMHEILPGAVKFSAESESRTTLRNEGQMLFCNQSVLCVV
jgi:hypothetical protein